jgi:hypothetical protein
MNRKLTLSVSGPNIYKNSIPVDQFSTALLLDTVQLLLVCGARTLYIHVI